MGADPYWYYVPYENDKNNALQKLRKREFEAGRYSPVVYAFNLDFPFDNIADAPAPGKMHETIEDAIEDAMESGTGTILDIDKLSDAINYGAAYVLKEEELRKYFGTDKPTRKIVDEKVWDFWNYVANKFGVRGVGICITVYKDDMPNELYFGGYSYD